MRLSALSLFIVALVTSAAMEKPSRLPARQDETILLDFSTPELPKGTVLSSSLWKVESGELRGTGGGWIELPAKVAGAWTLTFDGWTQEKASFEVKLWDKAGAHDAMSFAFGGMYHPVLDGPKSCILKGDRFVNICSKMWIFPGRMFNFEVRHSKNQYQMFLNGELGPFFVDNEPIKDDAAPRMRIHFGCEGAKDGFRLDNIKLVLRK